MGLNRTLTARDIAKSEAMIQAEFYHQCRRIGLPVFLELSTPIGRLDIAILNQPLNGVVAIVECKAAWGKQDYAQINDYRRIAAPIFWCCTMEEAQTMPQLLMDKYHRFSGVSLDDIMRMESARSSRGKGVDARTEKEISRWMRHLAEELKPRGGQSDEV